MRETRGAENLPGEIRRSQNWIGGTRPGNVRYVPPPHHEVAEALSFDALCRAKILREITGKQRDRVYAYHDYFQLLAADTE